MVWLRSLLFAVIFYTATLFFVLAAFAVTWIGPRPVRAVAHGWAWFHRAAIRLLLGQRIRVEGTIPAGNYLYIFKHESMFETLDILCLLNNPVVVAKRELLDIPLWGRIARRYGIVPVEREAGAKAMRAMRSAALEAMAAGRPVCIFPEGTRVPHGEAPPLKAGFAGLYILLKLPVVPVAVDSGRVSPRNSFRKHAGVITYRVGEVVPPGLPRDEAEARVHAAINALNPRAAGTSA